jgi:PhzF family phenazine biosynthesis protein
MMKFFQIDAFAERVFTGNPAGVCVLDEWLPDAVLMAIAAENNAAENNLSETAFFIPDSGGAASWPLRWFTPLAEIDLCGHATLAAAWVVFSVLEPGRRQVAFSSRSGPLAVRRDETPGRLVLDFPARPAQACAAPDGLFEALGVAGRPVSRARDLLVVLDDEAELAALRPDMAALAGVLAGSPGGVIVTAPADAGRNYAFAARFFAPHLGIAEDPVTGSAYCTLAPYWAGRLGTPALVARQLSARGGVVYCHHVGDRVAIGGACVLYLSGTLTIGEP